MVAAVILPVMLSVLPMTMTDSPSLSSVLAVSDVLLTLVESEIITILLLPSAVWMVMLPDSVLIILPETGAPLRFPFLIAVPVRAPLTIPGWKLPGLKACCLLFC